MNSLSALAVAAALGLFACYAGSGETPAMPGSVAAEARGVRDGTTTLTVGQTLAIALPSNATTGYRWQVADTYGDVLAPGAPFGEEVVDAHAPGVVGVGGATSWRFRAMRPGVVILTFAYGRSWERDTPPAETATYTITVR